MVGIYGFCWGGKMSLQASHLVGATAIVHPAFIEVTDVEKVQSALCIVDSKDEDEATFDKFTEEAKKKFGDKIWRKRYGDMFHGFCAGRANYADPENGKQANSVLNLDAKLI
jgi:dienelactone hydrolase